MGFEEITIGKIRSPDIFYFVPVHENCKVHKNQVKEMNEFFNVKEEPSVRICSIAFQMINVPILDLLNNMLRIFVSTNDMILALLCSYIDCPLTYLNWHQLFY